LAMPKSRVQTPKSHEVSVSSRFLLKRAPLQPLVLIRRLHLRLFDINLREFGLPLTSCHLPYDLAHDRKRETI
jgi:hypothetical protein